MSTDNPAQPTDAQILAAARELNRLQAIVCRIDVDDQWKMYGNSFIIDASHMLRAAFAVKAAAAPQPAQEPVAQAIADVTPSSEGPIEAFTLIPYGTLLYAAPAQAAPVAELVEALRGMVECFPDMIRSPAPEDREWQRRTIAAARAALSRAGVTP